MALFFFVFSHIFFSHGSAVTKSSSGFASVLEWWWCLRGFVVFLLLCSNLSRPLPSFSPKITAFVYKENFTIINNKSYSYASLHHRWYDEKGWKWTVGNWKDMSTMVRWSSPKPENERQRTQNWFCWQAISLKNF